MDDSDSGFAEPCPLPSPVRKRSALLQAHIQRAGGTGVLARGPRESPTLTTAASPCTHPTQTRTGGAGSQGGRRPGEAQGVCRVPRWVCCLGGGLCVCKGGKKMRCSCCARSICAVLLFLCSLSSPLPLLATIRSLCSPRHHHHLIHLQAAPGTRAGRAACASASRRAATAGSAARATTFTSRRAARRSAATARSPST